MAEGYSIGLWLAKWSLEMSLWTAAILLIAWVGNRALQRKVEPSLRVALFAAVFLRVVIPVDWGNPFLSGLIAADQSLGSSPSGITGLTQTGVVESNVTNGSMHVTRSTLLQQSGGEGPSLLRDLVGNTSVGAFLSELPVRQFVGADGPQVGKKIIAAPRQIGWAILVTYGVGVFFLILRLANGRRKLRLILSEAREFQAEHASRVKTKGYQVLQHASAGPFAFGWFRKGIVIPAEYAKKLSGGEMAQVMAHELAHHERKDLWVAETMNWICAVAWPVFPLWIARAQVLGLIEQAADAQALQGASESECKSYGYLLFRLAEGQISSNAFGTGLAPVISMSPYANLRGRIVALQASGSWNRCWQASVVAGLAAFGMALTGSAKEPESLRGELDILALHSNVSSEEELEEEACWQQPQLVHEQAEKSADIDTYRLADELYTYAEQQGCGSKKVAYDNLYYHGELIWALAVNLYQRADEGDRDESHEQFFRAADQWRKVLERDPKGKFVEDAALGQLLAIKNAIAFEEEHNYGNEALEQMLGGEKLRKDSEISLQAMAYSSEIQYMMQALELHLRYASELQEKIHLSKYWRIKLAMQFNRFDEAMPWIHEFLEQDSKSEMAVWVAEMKTDILTIWWTQKDQSPKQSLEQGKELKRFLLGLQDKALWQREEAKRLREQSKVLLLGIRHLESQKTN